MLLIGAAIVALICIFIGVPVTRVISRAMRPKRPVLARITVIGFWVGLATLVTWPVLSGPLVFELKCSNFTRLDVPPPIDARASGYFDERLSLPAHIQTHFDEFFLDRDVDDLLAGRIAFFERRHPSPYASAPFLRYSLIEAGASNCAPKVTGGTYGRAKLPQVAPTKCLGVEMVQSAASQFTVSASGDLNTNDGTTRITDRSSHEVLAMFRSFGRTYLYGGTKSCPIVRVRGDDYGGHINFTKAVFMDASGKVEELVRK